MRLDWRRLRYYRKRPKYTTKASSVRNELGCRGNLHNIIIEQRRRYAGTMVVEEMRALLRT